MWERLAMDYVRPIPQSESVTRVVYDNTSTTVARFLLYDVFMIYGILLDIITDNGCHFTLSLYKLMLQ
ncbi:unnamed protein product [Rotaria magnacalcarata]|uniref:Uncharacterized protein n=1 Tax=Rotaria magnacalcarata TaxID=392030 RepID=A0A8S2L848_9BILA|nr:unnamed protein product [Rotaria magnacalcarata]